jgi:LuxR family maltose regulon positive regulatory protein
LLELDADALRFTKREATALLNDLRALELDPTTVGRLHERTEGWVAGLFLAALSLRERDDTEAFAADFAGDDRHIADYVCAEVLAGQPADLRKFLLRTAILDRFCPRLCEAVTGAGGGARLLVEIERSNVLLVPLDSRREWYRYHHLFGELLRNELALVAPRAFAELHRRAAMWLLKEGLVSEAIGHRIAAGEVDEAGELIRSTGRRRCCRPPETGRSSSGSPRSARPRSARMHAPCIARCFVALSSAASTTSRRG